MCILFYFHSFDKKNKNAPFRKLFSINLCSSRASPSPSAGWLVQTVTQAYCVSPELPSPPAAPPPASPVPPLAPSPEAPHPSHWMALRLTGLSIIFPSAICRPAQTGSEERRRHHMVPRGAWRVFAHKSQRGAGGGGGCGGGGVADTAAEDISEWWCRWGG